MVKRAHSFQHGGSRRRYLNREVKQVYNPHGHVARLLNAMVQAGIITNYAVFGAVAQMRYTEAVATFDADILVAVPRPDVLDVLTPIYEFCQARGYRPEGEAIRVGDWPVQFIPAFSPLTEAAMRDAENGDVDGVVLRVVRADYLAVIALSVGRAKDFCARAGTPRGRRRDRWASFGIGRPAWTCLCLEGVRGAIQCTVTSGTFLNGRPPAAFARYKAVG